MNASLLALAAAQPGQTLPPGATGLDMGFAYGALALIVVAIWWYGRDSRDPPAP